MNKNDLELLSSQMDQLMDSMKNVQNLLTEAFNEINNTLSRISYIAMKNNISKILTNKNLENYKRSDLNVCEK